jgi:superoxide dismutase, Cu-Zn family
MRKKMFYVSGIALLASACVPNSPSVEAQRARLADGARVEMRDAHGKTVGTLTVAPHSNGGVRFTGRLSDLPSGVHGFHIHEYGKCDPPDFKSAGAHFNPSGRQHGEFNPQGKHEGDMGNVRVDAGGSAEVSLMNERVTLGAGPNSLLKPGGTSLVLHADADDQKTDPSGNSGDRIACGIIVR